MIVGCPKCYTKLKVSDEKIAPEGTKFKCPKCSAILLVKKPAPQPQEIQPQAVHTRTTTGAKIIVAHSNPAVVAKISSLLARNDFSVLTAQDGVEAAQKIAEAIPAVAILDVALPEIFGFDLCKQFKDKAETRDIKVILISSIYDKNRYRREPNSLYGADDYIEEHNINSLLIEKINSVLGNERPGIEQKKEETKETLQQEISNRPVFDRLETPKVERHAPASTVSNGNEEPFSMPKIQKPSFSPEPSISKTAETFTRPEITLPPVTEEITAREEIKIQPAKKEIIEEKNPAVEKARRLARTIVADIYLYSPTKMESSMKNDSFSADFAPEIREGLKLYNDRVAKEVREKGDFFNEAINNFIREKKKTLNL
ncbi:MAG: zinc-ribbon domain-containing protein [Nitrospiraceae bacterium]|nr:zinc-ribbon domain-containing protein [Nitrospiraceae bacterium]